MLVIPPPPVPGIGTGGGFKLMIQDRAGRGPQALEAATQQVVAAANQAPGIAFAFSLFNTATPQIRAEIDRTRGRDAGRADLPRASRRIGTYMGSAFVNDFNLLGRTYRVTAQADKSHRMTSRTWPGCAPGPTDGAMVPLGSRRDVPGDSGPYRVPRYNLYPGGRGAGRGAAGHLDRPGDRRDGAGAAARPAAGLRLRMDRDRPAGEHRRQHRADRLRPGGGLRLPGAGGACTRAGCCRWRWC